MWINSIKIPTGEKVEQDEAGFPTKRLTFMEGIPANFRDLTRNDQILASQSGYNADVLVEVMACNYSGQKTFIDEATGDVYEVKRTFKKSKGNSVYLTCERRENGTI